MIEEKSLSHHVRIDSAGTGAWHVGNSPDDRAQAVGKELGYQMGHLRARQVSPSDFDEFDYIIAMDQSNLANLRAMMPSGYGGVLALMRDFAGENGEEVPVPYYGGIDGYYHVFDLLKPAALGLLEHIEKTHLSGD